MSWLLIAFGTIPKVKNVLRVTLSLCEQRYNLYFTFANLFLVFLLDFVILRKFVFLYI